MLISIVDSNRSRLLDAIALGVKNTRQPVFKTSELERQHALQQRHIHRYIRRTLHSALHGSRGRCLGFAEAQATLLRHRCRHVPPAQALRPAHVENTPMQLSSSRIAREKELHNLDNVGDGNGAAELIGEELAVCVPCPQLLLLQSGQRLCVCSEPCAKQLRMQLMFR